MRCPVCGVEQEERTAACPACGADLVLLRPGEVVAGRYEVRAHLGRGGMGSVYRAFDRLLREEVALKVQRAETGAPDAERRFRRELTLAGRVAHANVCRVRDGGQDGSRRFIAMDLVPGETLAVRLARGPLAPEEALSLAIQAADGLAAVHAAGVVHRDLKSANVMVDAAGCVRLLDFGIARPATAATVTGYALGSPESMSPEQARGERADARSDVYSLGIVLFEMWTGAVPFRAETPVATLLQHLGAEPPLERVPEGARAVVARALAKDPRGRYADGAELAAALRALRDGRPLPSPGHTRRRAVSAVAAAATLLVLALVSWPFVSAPPPPPPTLASGPLVAPSPAPSLTPAGATPSAAPSPSSLVPDAAADRQSSPAARPSPTATPAGAAETAPREQATTTDRSPATVAPTPVPTPVATPTPAERPAAPVADGTLLVVVQPWADVSVDGIPRGQTPLGRIALAPGPHAVLLTHPDYQPYPRRVTIRSGETLRLVVDLRSDGVRRR